MLLISLQVRRRRVSLTCFFDQEKPMHRLSGKRGKGKGNFHHPSPEKGNDLSSRQGGRDRAFKLFLEFLCPPGAGRI